MAISNSLPGGRFALTGGAVEGTIAPTVSIWKPIAQPAGIWTAEQSLSNLLTEAGPPIQTEDGAGNLQTDSEIEPPWVGITTPVNTWAKLT